MKLTGQVLWYDKRDGYGQIIDASQTRYYTDDSVLMDFVTSGDSVEFEINPDIQSCLCAMNVTKRGVE